MPGKSICVAREGAISGGRKWWGEGRVGIGDNRGGAVAAYTRGNSL